MAWVNIKGRQYHRRSRRVGGCVVTSHIGGGEFGLAMACVDDAERFNRRFDDELK